MEMIFKIENISLLNEFLGQDPPKHPMISIIDFSKVDFNGLVDFGNQKVTTAFYSIILKQLKKGSIKYGRQHLDFQNGSLFFTAPNQLANIVLARRLLAVALSLNDSIPYVFKA